MEVVSVRLATLFNNLKATELSTTKIPSDSNIEKFRKILNMAAPVTDYDTAIGEFVRFLHRTDRASFFKYIHIANLVHLVLLTDGQPIVSVLGLRNIITIRWNRQRKEFTVTSGGANSMDNALNNVISENPAKNNKPKQRGKRRETRGRGERRERALLSSSSPSRKDTSRIAPLSMEQCVDIINMARATSPKTTSGNACELLSSETKDKSPVASQLLQPGESWAELIDEDD